MAKQLDIFRTSPQSTAKAYRRAAETELHNPFYTLAERQARHNHYVAEAERLERQHEPQPEVPNR